MRRGDIATIEHDVCIADGREVTGTVHQQQRYVRGAFQDAMNKSSDKVTLLGLNEYAAGKSGTSITGNQRGFHAVLNGGYLVWIEA